MSETPGQVFSRVWHDEANWRPRDDGFREGDWDAMAAAFLAEIHPAVLSLVAKERGYVLHSAPMCPECEGPMEVAHATHAPHCPICTKELPGHAYGCSESRDTDLAAWAEIGDRLARLEGLVREHDERLGRLERWRAGEIRRAIAGDDPLRRSDEVWA